jgi:hypothetical protein
MINRVSSLLIGKDIDRDVALDKNMKVLAAGATVANSDTIYLVQATGDTFDYTNIASTAITGNRRIKMSGPIVGSKVKTYEGRSFTNKAEQTASLTLTGMTPVVGTEYLIRLVYKDMKEHPGQFTQTYRYVSTTAVLDTFGAAIVAKINNHAGRRVNATYTSGTDVILLTSREIPESTSTVTDIDKFTMVEFDAFFNYVNSSGNWATWPTTSTTVTYSQANYGSGNWEQIRDLEKDVQPYRGITNVTHFPVIEPTKDTVKEETYDMIVIEHDVPYQSPDNQYVKEAPQTTVLALPVAALQTTAILAQLNPWMASVNFEAVTF